MEICKYEGGGKVIYFYDTSTLKGKMWEVQIEGWFGTQMSEISNLRV